MNMPVTGPVFPNKNKGNSTLHGKNFLASNEWFEGVQAWHHINFWFLSGESAEVNMETAEDWKSEVHHVMDEYPPSNQFNADEMGLFYWHMPKKSLTEKGEKVTVEKYPWQD